MPDPRLFVDQPLAPGAVFELQPQQAHYLRNVLRLRSGGTVLAFNGQDGEWVTHFGEGRRGTTLVAIELRRPQRAEPGPTLLIAPIKRPRLEWLLEKAVELGASQIMPVLTERSVVRPEASHRLRARAIEAAEQCERLTVPAIAEPAALQTAVEGVTAAGLLGFADEAGGGTPLLRALEAEPIDALLIGPEGGFAPAERAALLSRASVRPVSLGPLILRAETAAIYAMACWRAVAERRGSVMVDGSSLTICEAATGRESR